MRQRSPGRSVSCSSESPLLSEAVLALHFLETVWDVLLIAAPKNSRLLPDSYGSRLHDAKQALISQGFFAKGATNHPLCCAPATGGGGAPGTHSPAPRPVPRRP